MSISMFEHNLTQFELEFGVKILPITITGKRFSFNGSSFKSDGFPVGFSFRITLTDTSAVIVYTASKLTDESRSALEQKIIQTYNNEVLATKI